MTRVLPGRRGFTVLLMVGLLSVMMVPAAFAAKGGKGAKAQIWIEESPVANATEAADDTMNYLDAVSFGHTSNNDAPWLVLECYQNDRLVFWQNRAGFEGGFGYGQPFTLGPSLAWTGGEADCVGILGHYHRKTGRFMQDATVDFHVMP